jgi:hypothetical protein
MQLVWFNPEGGQPMTTEDSRAAMRPYQVGVSAPHLVHHHGHHPWSRRQFLQAIGLLLGATAAGFPWGGGTALAAKPGSGIPSQLPNGSPVLQDASGIEIPFFRPIEVNPFAGVFDPVANPTTIWDFNGALGLIAAHGVSDPDHNSDGVARFWNCDVRFMTGVFRDRAGRTQQGTFCFFWLDVYADPGLGFDSPEIHSFNPGDLNEPGQPNYFVDGGVFWTAPVPKKSVKVKPGRGDAHFSVSDLAMFDYFTGVNSILRDGSDPIDATASVDIQWTGMGERLQVDNDTAGFGGQYENASATIEWSAENAAGYFFSTVNSSPTTIRHAFTAHVRNGVFHPWGPANGGAHFSGRHRPDAGALKRSGHGEGSYSCGGAFNLEAARLPTRQFLL